MQFVKMTGLERSELAASRAGLIPFLPQTSGALAPDEARIAGPEGAFAPVEQLWYLADLYTSGGFVQKASLGLKRRLARICL